MFVTLIDTVSARHPQAFNWYGPNNGFRKVCLSVPVFDPSFLAEVFSVIPNDAVEVVVGPPLDVVLSGT